MFFAVCRREQHNMGECASMKDVKKIRNFVVAGHSGSGKTTLCEAMLFKSGVIGRQGSVPQKNTVSDYTADEQDRQGSIYATPLNCNWNDCEFYFIDTPGYGEFIGETSASLYAADIMLMVVDGVNGIEVGSNRVWNLANKLNLPRCIFINNLDRERSDYYRVIEQIQEVYGKTRCIPFTVPVGKENSLSKVVHVFRDADVPQDLEAFVMKYREHIMDTIAESDEELMTRYLDGEELTEAEISAGLHQAIQDGAMVPVFAGSAIKDIGIGKLLNGVVNLFPSPADVGKFSQEDGTETAISPDAPAEALVFKSLIDPFVGQLNFIRVFNGTFRTDQEVTNLTTGTKEKIVAMLTMNGKTQKPVTEAGPGMMVALTKLKNTHTNNTLASGGEEHEMRKIKFPAPVMYYAFTTAKRGEEDKAAAALHKLTESDPTIEFKRHEETHELLLGGMGDQHLGNVIRKLKEVYKVELVTSTPKIPYRETITGKGEGHYRHKKQTGGHGQFAEVHLRIAANPDGFEFSNDVVGGNIPRNFIPAVEKGIAESMVNGPLAGCKVENVKVSVYDGKYHPVDSSEMAFKIAARGAFKEAMHQAKPILLEPVMEVKIVVPDEFMGDITGDLNHKRGRIMGMEAEEGLQVIRAEVPQTEMAKYATELRSMTQGRGSFEMEFNRYEAVPPALAAELIAKFQATQEEDE
ncbi:MAG: elongation factor G [Victivallales bacterium]|nr:elongation factor G [Victivallales bacterium]